MIAYFFPPMGGSGVYRTAKFVKYLPEFGWRPVVVCGDEARLFDYGCDESLLPEVPAEARVLRTRFVSPYGPRGRLRRLFRVRPTTVGPNSATPNQGDEGASGDEPTRNSPGALRLVGRVLHPLEEPPIDRALYWALSIVPLCRRVIESEKVDLIYTSSDPYSDHIAGYILKRLTGRPWVADFRDPWTQCWNYHHKGWRRRCDQIAEQRVLRDADRVIGVTPSETRGLLDLVPGRDPAAFSTIENGFDEEDFEGVSPEHGIASHPRGEQTVLTHVGIVYDGVAMPLLRALERLGPTGERLRVRFVGGLATQELRWLADHPVTARVEVSGRVAHAEAIAQMKAADAVLLIIGEGARWEKHYPGKLFEYLRCGSPILMIGPEGEASRVVQTSRTGAFAIASDVNAIAEALCLLAEQPEAFRARHFHPDPQVIERYERRALTARLATLFEDAVLSAGATDA